MYTKIKGAFYPSFVDDTVDKGHLVEETGLFLIEEMEQNHVIN